MGSGAPIARRLLEGQLVEIRADRLAFDKAEAADLLAAHRVVLDDSDLATLLDRTEGWAAGLRLAALSLSHADDPGSSSRPSPVTADPSPTTWSRRCCAGLTPTSMTSCWPRRLSPNSRSKPLPHCLVDRTQAPSWSACPGQTSDDAHGHVATHVPLSRLAAQLPVSRVRRSEPGCLPRVARSRR